MIAAKRKTESFRGASRGSLRRLGQHRVDGLGFQSFSQIRIARRTGDLYSCGCHQGIEIPDATLMLLEFDSSYATSFAEFERRPSKSRRRLLQTQCRPDQSINMKRSDSEQSADLQYRIVDVRPFYFNGMHRSSRWTGLDFYPPCHTLRVSDSAGMAPYRIVACRFPQRARGIEDRESSTSTTALQHRSATWPSQKTPRPLPLQQLSGRPVPSPACDPSLRHPFLPSLRPQLCPTSSPVMPPLSRLIYTVIPTPCHV